MIFRTVLPVKNSLWKISHRDAVLSAGSCFADYMSRKLSENQFSVCGNPFGIIFNPLVLTGNLSLAILGGSPEDEIILQNGHYYHYKLHSQVSGKTREEIKNKADSIFKTTGNALESSKFIIITLGTAFVYFLKEGNIPVANCHKMPSKLFEKRMLSPEEIVRSFEDFIALLEKINPEAKFILSVSPVRHIKDSLELNSVSKSVLRYATWQITEKFPDKITYFPAFEILTDDLRDYRFYREDMIHPGIEAEDYIWKRFGEMFFSSETADLIREIEEITAAINHRPFHPDSPEYQNFIAGAIEKAKKLNDKVAVKSLIENLALKLGL